MWALNIRYNMGYNMGIKQYNIGYNMKVYMRYNMGHNSGARQYNMGITCAYKVGCITWGKTRGITWSITCILS